MTNILPWLKQWLKKNIATLVMVVVSVSSLAVGYTLSVQKTKNVNTKSREIIEKYNTVAKAFLELKKKYQDLETDRNNVLTQTKSLLSEKTKYDEIKAASEEMEKANKILSEQKDKLHQENQRLRNDRDVLAEKYDQLKKAYQDIYGKQKAAESEAGRLRADLKKQVELSPQYQKVTAENKALKADNKKLSETILSLMEKLKKANERLKKIADRDLKFSKQIEAYRTIEKRLITEKNALLALNKKLNLAVDEGPSKFRDMAEQNKKLLKETAEMHYNLGVFYTENRNFVLAAKEFQRALDFDPNNSKAHYNLGYIYSEQLDKQEEAMAHFQKFLQINPNSKESNEIRSYMVVRQAYGDKIASAK